MKKPRTSKKRSELTIRYDLRQVGLMLRVAVYFKPSMFKEVGAGSPEEVAICSELMRAGLCAPTPAVLRFLNLETAGEGCYVWHLQ